MAASGGGDSSLLRRINSAATLRALRGGAALTVTELMDATGLSRPTVEGVVDGLLGERLVVEAEPESGPAGRRRGRPARRLRFHAEAGYLLAVDIGMHEVRCLLADLTGTVVARHSRPVHGVDAEERLDRTRAAVTELLRRAHVSRDLLWAAGVGSPGIVDRKGVVTYSAAVPGWTGTDLGGRLSRSLRCPVLVENDANLAAIGERWQGVAAGSDDVVYILAGLSPGAGSLINGRVHRGFGGAAGEIGALHLLGRQAPPETLLSTTGTPLVPLDEEAVAEVFRLARTGDAVAREAVDRFVQRLVHDITAMVLTLDPEIVVVGGWAAGIDDVVEPLRAELAKFCLRLPRVELSALGSDGIGLGALRVALDHAEQRLFAVSYEGAPHS
ncbi:ROK family protein [Yinghuangia seranimata]|uniref:ROK family protein n=1 Tax=Yinghuangia seranimata TaxID=408067 RepID=UPI00248ADBA3|nr:ROK family protein [Yinghuangia seranimata]MDI2130619.1 ROK family protein [Yinghuangia seranimata]